VLLQRHLEDRSGKPIDELAAEMVFAPLGMRDSRLDEPEPGYHGYRPLLTTGADFGRFLAHVLGIDDERWRPQWRIDDELAWGAGWGLELGPPPCGWQWGSNDDASNFVIGCRASGDGVVVLTDAADARSFYREVVANVLPGDHASLRVEHNPTWLGLFA
jgi:CubicO group peptidase (beta-lactamase class C family)